MSTGERNKNTLNFKEFTGLLGTDDEYKFREIHVVSGKPFRRPKGWELAFKSEETDVRLYRKEKKRKIQK